MFNDHYPVWNKKRIDVVHKHYSKSYFSKKTTLEVGCGHAFFSKRMLEYGAIPTASDAREEYLNLPKGNQLSVGSIEQILISSGKKFMRIDDKDLNCYQHCYDWEIIEDTSWKTGRRKFWIIGE